MTETMNQGAAMMPPPLVQPEVQKFLEAVFAVAPHPEEYVRYRLHLATALSPDFLDAWFENRRATAKQLEEAAVMQLKSSSDAIVNDVNTNQSGQSRAFSLFGTQARPSLSYEQKSLALLASTTREVQDVDRLLAIMQNNPNNSSWENQPAEGNGFENFRGNGQLASYQSGDVLDRDIRSQNDEYFNITHLAAEPDRSNGELPNNRFNEADLDVVSKLVGLDRLNSTELHGGSRALYMFEQLTALDSLDPDVSGTRRKRTRHQHFWRNTDKLDPRDRVYVSTASLRPALQSKQPVSPKTHISADERTNSWTVCLTTSGVINYLNKRISPLGVQMIRALARRCRAQQQTNGPLDAALALPAEQAGFKRVRARTSSGEEDPARPAKTLKATSESASEEGSPSEGDKSQETSNKPPSPTTEGNSDQAPAFEPPPRARRRKPA